MYRINAVVIVVIPVWEVTLIYVNVSVYVANQITVVSKIVVIVPKGKIRLADVPVLVHVSTIKGPYSSGKKWKTKLGKDHIISISS